MVVKTVHIELSSGWTAVPTCGWDLSGLFEEGPSFADRQWMMGLGVVLAHLESLRAVLPSELKSFDLIVPEGRTFQVDVARRRFVIGRHWIQDPLEARPLMMTAHFQTLAPHVDVASLHLLAERVENLFWQTKKNKSEATSTSWLSDVKRLDAWCEEAEREPWGHRSCDSEERKTFEPLSLKKHLGKIFDRELDKLDRGKKLQWLRSRLVHLNSLPSLGEMAKEFESLADIQTAFQDWGARFMEGSLSPKVLETPIFDLVVVSQVPVENWRELVELRNWLMQRPSHKVVLKLGKDWYFLPETAPMPLAWPTDMKAKQVAIVGCSDELHPKDVLMYQSIAHLVAFVKSCTGHPNFDWKSLLVSSGQRAVGRLTEAPFVNFRSSAVLLAQKHGVLLEGQNLMNIEDMKKRLGWSSVKYSVVDKSYRPEFAVYEAIDSYR